MPVDIGRATSLPIEPNSVNPEAVLEAGPSTKEPIAAPTDHSYPYASIIQEEHLGDEQIEKDGLDEEKTTQEEGAAQTSEDSRNDSRPDYSGNYRRRRYR